MRDIKKRLEALERCAYDATGVCVISPSYIGGWMLQINTKNRYYDTLEEAAAAYKAFEKADTALIYIDI